MFNYHMTTIQRSLEILKMIKWDEVMQLYIRSASLKSHSVLSCWDFLTLYPLIFIFMLKSINLNCKLEIES